MIIIRYAEIALKGKNRHLFEKKLITNIKDCLKQNNINFTSIERLRGRILVEAPKESLKYLKTIFGIASISHAITILPNMEEIKQTSLKLHKSSPFKVHTQRITKTTNLNSMQINQEVGAEIVKKTKAKVDLTNPKQTIYIEIINNNAYIFDKKVEGPKGLPVGTQGLVSVLLENKNSLKAAYLMLKRGCSINIIKKKPISIKELKKYSYGSRIDITKTPPKYSKAIITSETLETIKPRKYKIPILRPLIGYNKPIKL